MKSGVKPIFVQVGRSVTMLRQIDALRSNLDVRRLYAAIDARLRPERVGRMKGGVFFKLKVEISMLTFWIVLHLSPFVPARWDETGATAASVETLHPPSVVCARPSPGRAFFEGS